MNLNCFDSSDVKLDGFFFLSLFLFIFFFFISCLGVLFDENMVVYRYLVNGDREGWKSELAVIELVGDNKS